MVTNQTDPGTGFMVPGWTTLNDECKGKYPLFTYDFECGELLTDDKVNLNIKSKGLNFLTFDHILLISSLSVVMSCTT